MLVTWITVLPFIFGEKRFSTMFRHYVGLVFSLYIEGSGYATTATKLAEAEKRQKECKGYWQVYIFRGVGA